MTFRKDSLLFYEQQVALSIFTIVCVVIGLLAESTFLVSFAIPFVIIALVIPTFYKEYITMDEAGISCHKSGKELWSYEWSDIAILKRSSYCRHPSVEIMVFDSGKKTKPYRYSGQFFLLGRIARNAMKEYYRMNETEIAKKLYFWSFGNYAVMRTNGIYEEYKKMSISKEIERKWGRELKEQLITKTISGNTFSYLDKLAGINLPNCEIVDAFQQLSVSSRRKEIYNAILRLQPVFDPSVFETIKQFFDC